MNEVIAYLKTRRARFLITTSIFSAILAVSILLNLALGSSLMDPFSVLAKGSEQIMRPPIGIEGYRVERAFTAVVVGMALAFSGYLIQVSSKNPLGDPYLLGISSGALLAVVFTFMLPATFFSLFILRPIAALFGGLLAYLLTLIIATKAGLTPTSLVLSGVAVGTTLYSVSLLPQYLTLQKIHEVFVWSQGSFVDPEPIASFIILLSIIFSLVFIAGRFKVINALSVSDELVKELGASPDGERKLLTFIASLLASFSVAWFGIIGFIGLASPHVARRFLRSGDAKLVLIPALIFGSALTTFSDAVAKAVVYPIELPVNVIVSLFGGPALALILVGMRRHA